MRNEKPNEIWKMEPNLANTINSMMTRDWSLVGKRDLIKHYTDVLRDAENGTGYSAFTLDEPELVMQVGVNKTQER